VAALFVDPDHFKPVNDQAGTPPATDSCAGSAPP
jgi:hypothetical protein